MTISEHVARARARLLAAGVPAEEAPGDAEVLARHALGWDLTRYAVGLREDAPARFVEQYAALIDRRSKREPVSQIVGHREFWGLDFEVTRDVLTPRPETELVVRAALDVYPTLPPTPGGHPVIVDIGTGSGCIVVALATELPNAVFVASDVSLAAITLARRNAATHGVANRIAFLRTGIIPPESDIEMIVSNPPYVPGSQAASLAPEVRDYEPHVALFGPDEDGLGIYRTLFEESAQHFIQGGWMIVEVGYDQADSVRSLATPGEWKIGPVYRDLQGIERVLTFQALPSVARVRDDSEGEADE